MGFFGTVAYDSIDSVEMSVVFIISDYSLLGTLVEWVFLLHQKQVVDWC